MSAMALSRFALLCPSPSLPAPPTQPSSIKSEAAARRPVAAAAVCHSNAARHSGTEPQGREAEIHKFDFGG